MRPVADTSGLESFVHGLVYEVPGNGVAIPVLKDFERNGNRAWMRVCRDIRLVDEYSVYLRLEATTHPGRPGRQLLQRFADSSANPLAIGRIITIEDHQNAIQLETLESTYEPFEKLHYLRSY